MKRILVLDNSRVTLHMIENALKGWNYEIVQLDGTDDIINRIIRVNPALIILPVETMASDGYELCSEIKKNPELNPIPVIFLSSYDSRKHINKCMNAGGSAVVRKEHIQSDILPAIKHSLMKSEVYSSMKALVVDDDPVVHSLVSDILKQIPTDVYSVHSAEEAIALLKEGRIHFDLFIIDYILKEMNGIELCEKIRSEYNYADQPVIFLSSLSDQNSIKKFFEAGASDYINKPFGRNELISRVRVHLNSYILLESLERSREELSLKNIIANAFLKTSTSDSYKIILDALLKHFNSRFGLIGYLDEEGNLVIPTMTHEIWDECRMKDKNLIFLRNEWGGLWGRSLIEKKPLMLNSGLKVPAGHIGLDRAMCVPVIFQEQLLGLAAVANKETDYTENDLALLNSIGDYIAPIMYARMEKFKYEMGLIQAKDEAEKANTAKTRFLARMSHEMRTPLNAIIGLTDLTLGINKDLAQSEYLKIIKDSSNHLLTVINDVLDFAKINTGTVNLSCVEFDLHSILNRTVVSLQYFARDNGLQLKLEINDAVPESVKGDPDKLRQILINLISNSVKFTEAGIITVKVSTVDTEIIPGTDFMLEVAVEDTGIGIPPDKLDTIFGSFTQLDGTLTRKHGGSGLGLAITKSLVTMMDGNIEVKSELGKGSRFIFQIKLQKLSEQAADSGPEPSGKAAPDEPVQFNILLAEDNAVNAMLAKALLERAGHKVQIAVNGLEAVGMLKISGFDVVLMDIEMPEMDGLEATESIRRGDAGEKNTGIPIIAMTAHVVSEMMDNCKKAGMNDCVTKPFKIEELNETILKAVKKF